jgi:hypothetical protein
MRKLKFSSLFILVISVLLFSGCSDDDTPEVSPFVGNYTITEAKILAINPVINTNEMGPLPIPPGTDITAAIQASLLSQVNCSSADKSWVELREDNSMYMSCEGSNELNAGTWDEVSPTELKLNMNSAAIPSSPTGIVLNVTDIAIAGSNLSGTTSVPLPKDMIAALVAQMGAGFGVNLTLSANNPDIFMVNFSIVFEKK